MKSVWAALGIFGGVCFLTMGLPLLLAVGLVGLLSTSVWVPLLAVVIGVGALATSMALSRRCQSCLSATNPRPRQIDARARRGG